MNFIKNKFSNKFYNKIFVALIWLFIWQMLYLIINESIIFPEPKSVFMTLFSMMKTAEFWKTLLFSLGRVLLSMTYGITIGVVLLFICYKSYFFRSVISPLISAIKAMPVATFIILLMFFVKSKNVPVIIGTIMVVPIVYNNLLQGIKNIDRELIEMVNVFHVPFLERLTKLYIPSIMPYLIATINVCVSFCFKATISAEVLSIPKNSIGLNIYNAKIYFDVDTLFAWTIIIVVSSVLLEFLVKKITMQFTSEKIH